MHIKDGFRKDSDTIRKKIIDYTRQKKSVNLDVFSSNLPKNNKRICKDSLCGNFLLVDDG